MVYLFSASTRIFYNHLGSYSYVLIRHWVQLEWTHNCIAHRCHMFYFLVCMSYSEIKSGSFSKLPQRYHLHCVYSSVFWSLTCIGYVSGEHIVSVYSGRFTFFTCFNPCPHLVPSNFLGCFMCVVWELVADRFVNEMDGMLVFLVVTTLIVWESIQTNSGKRRARTHSRVHLQIFNGIAHW